MSRLATLSFNGATLDNTLGAVIVGFAAACCVYGILITQVFTYFSNYPEDRLVYKILVIVILLLETADQAMIGHICYFYAVTNFASILALTQARVTWSFILQQTVGAVVGAIVKFMFGLRVWRFSNHNFLITGFILFLTLGGLGTALAFTFKAFQLPGVFAVIQLQVISFAFLGSDMKLINCCASFLHNNKTLGTTSLGIGVLTDIVTAASLCYFLNRLRTGHRNSDTLVNSLVRYAINTGVLTSTVSLTTLILYNVMPTNMVFIATYFVLSKLYAISFMATLNTRRVVRGKGTDRQGDTTASNVNTNMFHLGTRVPSLGPNNLDGWEAAYTASHGAAKRCDGDAEVIAGQPQTSILNDFFFHTTIIGSSVPKTIMASSPLLPVELFYQLIDCLIGDRPTLKSLSLVCRDFSLKCQSLLFEDLELEDNQPRNLQFLDISLSSSGVSRLVHRLHIINNSPADPQESETMAAIVANLHSLRTIALSLFSTWKYGRQILESLVSTLQMPTLAVTCLQLMSATFTHCDELCSLLNALPQLQHLILGHITIDTSTSLAQQSSDSDLSLFPSQPLWAVPLQLHFPDSLRFLRVMQVDTRVIASILAGHRTRPLHPECKVHVGMRPQDCTELAGLIHELRGSCMDNVILDIDASSWTGPDLVEQSRAQTLRSNIQDLPWNNLIITCESPRKETLQALNLFISNVSSNIQRISVVFDEETYRIYGDGSLDSEWDELDQHLWRRADLTFLKMVCISCRSYRHWPWWEKDKQHKEDSGAVLSRGRLLSSKDSSAKFWKLVTSSKIYSSPCKVIRCSYTVWFAQGLRLRLLINGSPSSTTTSIIAFRSVARPLRGQRKHFLLPLTQTPFKFASGFHSTTIRRMPVELQGSCHCGAVRFKLQSSTPVPYQLCTCSICRKVGGVGGSINLGGFANTLEILKGKEHISVYKAVMERDTPKEHIVNSERNFCSKCSSMLWLFDSTWPELIHPFASVIDNPELQTPDTMVVVKSNSKPDYVRLPEGKKEVYENYGPHSIEEWHKKNGVYAE
ncbi:hypothetical protein D9758_005642 [Tetrapyrgos nigripes]|uniref:CENP-V/GFA domain-containing protein n=1 Tax=Tetrapyrgos nigripes TaxID=182062 RepID=A0A8H5GGG8_9AGAR|nr:hypothetical protein D9758_005642 [Tetrapyrgos nigripes]